MTRRKILVVGLEKQVIIMIKVPNSEKDRVINEMKNNLND
jgi:hypothetical protein